MRIGELAHDAGLPSRTIRYYERRGLLAPPERAENGYRVYDEAARDRLRFIRRAQAAGFTLAEIRGVIEVWAEGEPPCAHVADLIESKLAEVRRRRRELAAAERGLSELLERGRNFDPENCRDADICGILAEPDEAA